MPDDTGILSLDQAADALTTPVDDEQNAEPVNSRAIVTP